MILIHASWKITIYDIEAIRTELTYCLIFFLMVEKRKWLSRDLLSRWSLEGMIVYNDCLENIVLNEKIGY